MYEDSNIPNILCCPSSETFATLVGVQWYHLLMALFLNEREHFFKFFFFFLAALGLSCSMQDLVLEQGSNTGPLYWEHGILAGYWITREVPSLWF